MVIKIKLWMKCSLTSFKSRILNRFHKEKISENFYMNMKYNCSRRSYFTENLLLPCNKMMMIPFNNMVPVCLKFDFKKDLI